MSCSKIFSGDLPELTYEVMKYFQNDFLTLYSCILVNRLWCRLAIPLLWENPFSIPTKNYKFIEIYLQNLKDNDFKTKSKIYKIDDNLFYLNTLFNYPNFIKYINLLKVIKSVGKWFEDSVRTLKSGNRYFLQNPDKLSTFNFKRLIYISLFKIFIENEVNLNILNIDIFPISSYVTYYYDIFVLILQNSNFIHNIKNLNLYIGSEPSSVLIYNNNSENALIKSQILQVINLHQNLKKIILDNDSFPYYQSLFLSKEYNCSNTLNTIILYQVNFNSIINLDKIFEQLNVLESVHISYCFPLNSNFIQQIINLTKPFKLKSLFIEGRLQINLLELLLQKSGDYLENFAVSGFSHYDSSSKRQLIGLITKYCNNIKFLALYGFETQITHLIESINRNLNYLSILINEIYRDHNVGYNSTFLQNLGQILPSKLEYLSLSLFIKKSDFKIFLENTQNTFINRLVIVQQSEDDILHYIKEFIMKEKRVKYLAIRNLRNILDLSTLKDEVNEFMLYNIIVLNFFKLYLHVRNYEFVKNIDYYS
ncbi:uncharacterized protein OCT59_023912 [Rhizophagus irregularis]|uniref:uncharacterized protein n=1 Tax=Rhizophagus irregularis TaxID=588596 RepID=UPI000CB87FC1|nr:hypothetical protein OCT59_023912 [Rhizophagus irregularis]GBC21994.1 hypothetical protein GLOIN_2v1781395 [Rhizophagus irregularis DAOM 181602=DAOM 197198]